MITPPKPFSLSHLPIELHLQIASYLPQQSLSNLSRTSHHFHRLLIPHLYASPSLPTFHHLLLFCRTMDTNPHRIGRHIRHLRFHHPDVWDARTALNAIRKPGMMDSVKKTVRRRWLLNMETVELILPGELQLGGWWEKEWRHVRDSETEEVEAGKRTWAIKVALGNVMRDQGVVRFFVAPSPWMGWKAVEGKRGEWVRE